MEIFDLWEDLSVSKFLQSSVYAYPIVNGLHIVGVSLLFGSLAVTDVAILRGKPLDLACRYITGTSLLGFAFAVMTGLLLFGVQANTYAQHPLIWLKLGLILLAGVNAGLCHLSGKVRAFSCSVLQQKIHACLSLFLWVGTIFAARFVAFW